MNVENDFTPVLSLFFFFFFKGGVLILLVLFPLLLAIIHDECLVLISYSCTHTDMHEHHCYGCLFDNLMKHGV